MLIIIVATNATSSQVDRRGIDMDINSLNEKLMKVLRLRTWPVSVSLLKSAKSIPPTVKTPDSGFTFCQLLALARLNGAVNAGTAQSIVCAYATSALGFTDFPDDIRSGKRPLRMTKTEEAFARFVSSLPKIETGKFEAVVVSPLHRAPMEPDIVIISGTPAQMMRLLNAIAWNSGERTKFSSSAHCGVCAEGVAAPYLVGKPQLGVPCSGGRMFGLYQDDEMLMGVPLAQLEELVKGLEETERIGLTFPVGAWMCPPKGLPLMSIGKKMK